MIHTGNPFLPDPDDRDPVRRFRGRIAAGVTIVTSGRGDERSGLTVSSIILIDGDPAVTRIVVGPTSDLWSALSASGRFVAHICGFEHHGLADAFAGLAPAPGGVFVGVGTSDTEWGPALDDVPDRLYCVMTGLEEVGHSGLLSGRVEQVELSDLDDPLIHFRGGYHRLGT
jgi:3-hydroxy-9,10-secoandrosta-1,3,5(10)-triene-9,17-dione monooxygenase reductase component